MQNPPPFGTEETGLDLKDFPLLPPQILFLALVVSGLV
jgi:hypothetical protein